MFGNEMAGKILPYIMTFGTAEKDEIKFNNLFLPKLGNKITKLSFDNDVTHNKGKIILW